MAGIWPLTLEFQISRILATWERLGQLPSSQICKSQERDSLGHVSISEQVNWGQVLKWHEKVPASSRAECGRVCWADSPIHNHYRIKHWGESSLKRPTLVWTRWKQSWNIEFLLFCVIKLIVYNIFLTIIIKVQNFETR